MGDERAVLVEEPVRQRSERPATEAGGRPAEGHPAEERARPAEGHRSDGRPAEGGVLFLDDAADVRRAAEDLDAGCAVVHGFAGLYALTARADPEVVARVRRMTGDPGGPYGPAGGVTTVPSALTGLFDWTRLPAELPRRQVWSLMEELYELGPIGLLGPAADRLPAHVTCERDGVTAVQAVSPGRHCPSNDFLSAALDRTGAEFLFTTSANRAGELPHWRADAVARDLGHEPGVRVLAHADDDAARRRYPHHAPVAVSVVSFHRGAGYGRAGLPALTLERQGSLSAEHLRSVAANHGFALHLAPGATGTRPAPRPYVPSSPPPRP
ncbi:hypothetical protein ABZ135_08285 [Streptomyces sp. NPDC006339]|uniref:hypothetical protein n=1 Tax=Streptomyces sp. NPDC006339 TaxID=3156755 RepID=UPI0033A01F97